MKYRVTNYDLAPCPLMLRPAMLNHVRQLSNRGGIEDLRFLGLCLKFLVFSF